MKCNAFYFLFGIASLDKLTGRRVLKLLQMLIDDTMQSHANFAHDTFQILSIQIALNLLNDRDHLLDHVLTSG